MTTDQRIPRETTQIDVCIASYKRPQLLSKLLESLATQRHPVEISIDVIVVDNDPLGSARKVVEAATESGLRTRYFMQPIKNISLTRNMAVENSKGEFIAFIDDDECADVTWLMNLYTAINKYRADVVFGPVVGVLPFNAPAWIKTGKFFSRENRPTGSVVTFGATNNALVRASRIQDISAPFNAKYGLTGGEDTDFFQRLRESGAKLIWCNEAIVHEAISPERMTVTWLILRSFRGGQMFGEICVKHNGWLSSLKWLIIRSSLALIAILGAILSFPITRIWGVRCLQKFAGNVGQLSSLFRLRYKEYGE